MQPEKLCMACGEAITNPICPDCIATEIEYWIKDRNGHLLPELKKRTRNFKIMAYGRTHTCVLCGSEMNFCSYCYTEYIYEWLSIKSTKTAEEFARHFGYIKNN